MSALPILVSDWKPLRKGALRGFCIATLPSGMILHEISVFATNGKAWCSPPSKPMVGRDGKVIVGDNGKTKYVPLIEFVDRPTRDRFSDAIIAALLAAHPEALADA